MASGGSLGGPVSPTSPSASIHDSAHGFPPRGSSRGNGPNSSIHSPPRKPLPPIASYPAARMQEAPLSPVRVSYASESAQPQASYAQVESFSASPGNGNSRSVSREIDARGPLSLPDFGGPLAVTQSVQSRPWDNLGSSNFLLQQMAALSPADSPPSSSPRMTSPVSGRPRSRPESQGSLNHSIRAGDTHPQLQYHHQQYSEDPSVGLVENRASKATVRSSTSDSPSSSNAGENATVANQHLAPSRNNIAGNSIQRPSSAYSATSELGVRGRTRSPQLSPNLYTRAPSAHSRQSPDSRPISYVDLLNAPYPQPPPAPASFDNAHLRTAVGSNASLLSTRQTLDMYRANVKKTNDPSIQYEFAVFMINAAQEAAAGGVDDVNPGLHSPSSPKPRRDLESPYIDNLTPATSQAELLREARQILQKLSDRSYPFAQYYLADGYASGLFNKGKEDWDRAFPLFVAASKHGHAEAGYRAALCYEFGWGSRKDPAKAVQFYRQAASKNHPGAMLRLGKACLLGDMGLTNRYREGLKWLRRAAESADFQYNSAPYELGLLHESGYGDDVFRDESYAAQLFTQSADLGHADANYRLGDAYEHGKLNCPRDPALSVHFYTGAAQAGHPLAMMALCAWYMVGAEPVLDKDENEAYEWAVKAAECVIALTNPNEAPPGLAKAEYAVGYFTEMGIGCRRDPLEANVWYVKAADQGDERAKHRIAAIRAAASGGSAISPGSEGPGKMKKSPSGNVGGNEEKGKSKRWLLF
ncbi:MAG: hypothetical protein M1830_006602 [Pleopsidium flavum]|nr:MAG: hypothetical protein M1830_006602 [Pleopsidium flavum]